MITGFNTDVKHGAKVYHVQTEDKGRNNPKIETLVYVGGEILDNHRTSYDESKEQLGEAEIMALMENQHRRVIRSIKVGRYDEQGKFPEGVLTDRTFDEVVAEYLGSEAVADYLLLAISGQDSLKSGPTTLLKVKAIKAISKEAVYGTSVRIKLVSSKRKPLILADGVTDEQGLMNAQLVLPDWGNEGTLVIQAISDWGTATQRIPLGI